MQPWSRGARALVVLLAGLLVGACASIAEPLPAIDEHAETSGTIVAIDQQPWTYDGNAVILIDTDRQRRVAVQLPARWNLCKAKPVDMEALSVGTRVHVVGRIGGDGAIVVCQDDTHRLVPVR